MVHAAWPDKPIRIVVAFPPGATTDIIARAFSAPLSEALGQPIIIENRPGAGGNIATVAVARSPADGYTLLMHSVAYAVNPSLYTKAGYEVGKDLASVAIAGVSPNILYVHPSVKANTLAELLALSKTDKLSYASSGNGSAQHLAGALFESATGVDMVHVPYKGGGPALNDVVGGQVPLFFGNLASTLQHVQSGKLRALAVTSAKRSHILSGVPTLSEVGVKGAEIYEWNAVFVPTGTPDAVVAKIASAFQQALDAPEVKQRIAQLGGEIQRSTPEQAQSFIEQQIALWGRVIKDRKIAVE